MSKLTSLLTTTNRSTATIVLSEDQLFDLFTHLECSTKTDMIMSLHNLGFDQSSIAKTLLEHGILSPKSSRQHVRNTIERKTGS